MKNYIIAFLTTLLYLVVFLLPLNVSVYPERFRSLVQIEHKDALIMLAISIAVVSGISKLLKSKIKFLTEAVKDSLIFAYILLMFKFGIMSIETGAVSLKITFTNLLLIMLLPLIYSVLANLFVFLSNTSKKDS
ncbi:MAG: hypothetical protein J7K98_03935 [Candidatus Aenigmarchaeota archaeon]|nr:hypothetical protein [Candidatus Aenigmarchaeota archaeon]